MIIKNAIWAEIERAKVITEYITLFSDRHRKYARRYNIIITIVSVAGIACWKYVDESPFIAIIIIILGILLKPAVPNLIMSDSELSQLDNLYIKYSQYLIELEIMFNNDNLELEVFMNLKNEIIPFDSELNKILREKSSLYKKALSYQEDYIKKIYRNEYPNNNNKSN